MRNIPELKSVAAGILLASSALTLDKCDQAIEALVFLFVVIVVVGALLLIVQLVLFGYSVHYLVRNRSAPTAQSRTRGIVVGSVSSLLSFLGLTSGAFGFAEHSATQVLGMVVAVGVLAVSVACVVVSVQAKPANAEASSGGVDVPAWPTGPHNPQAPNQQAPNQQPPNQQPPNQQPPNQQAPNRQAPNRQLWPGQQPPADPPDD